MQLRAISFSSKSKIKSCSENQTLSSTRSANYTVERGPSFRLDLGAGICFPSQRLLISYRSPSTCCLPFLLLLLSLHQLGIWCQLSRLLLRTSVSIAVRTSGCTLHGLTKGWALQFLLEFSFKSGQSLSQLWCRGPHSAFCFKPACFRNQMALIVCCVGTGKRICLQVFRVDCFLPLCISVSSSSLQLHCGCEDGWNQKWKRTVIYLFFFPPGVRKSWAWYMVNHRHWSRKTPSRSNPADFSGDDAGYFCVLSQSRLSLKKPYSF